MGDYDLLVRQPQPRDIIGSTLSIAALGTAFEASWEWKLTADGVGTLAQGFYQGGGSTGLMCAFVFEAQVEGVNYSGPANFEFNGDTGNESPVPMKVPVFVVPGAIGYVPYRVKEGDTLTKIVQQDSFGTGVATVANIAAVNELANPDNIDVGQLLRIPV